MKKALSLILALVLCLGLAVPALALDYGQEYAGYNPTPGQQYKDVPTTHWAFPSINTCSERGWFNGYPDGTFHPEGLITREEAAKVFAVAMDLTLPDVTTPSFDDTANLWSTAFIEATKVIFPNVQNLQGEKSFRPTKTITREETVYALVVAWKLASKTKNVDMSILNMFSDQQTISAAVKPYIAVAVNEKLVSGLPDGTFGGQKGLSRAEFSALLARALDHGYGADDTSAPQITLDRYSATTSEEMITLTGKVEPMMVGTTLKVGTQKVALAGDGVFSVTLDLAEGANLFTLTAANFYGNFTKEDVRVTYEKPEEPPQQQPVQQEPAQQQPVQQQPVQQQPEEPGRPVVASGICGREDENAATWTLYEDGELAVRGPGAVESYDRYYRAPWYEYRERIQSATVEGVTTIGEHAFCDCSNLTHVAISDSVTNIGGRAFQNCSSLTSVEIPDSVREIDDNAFYDCTALTSVTIPAGVDFFGGGTYSHCSGITSVTIEEGVTALPNYVLEWARLTEVVIPEGVTRIGIGAFGGCPDLHSVTIPSSVTVIDASAFEGCTSLTDVYYGGTAEQWASMRIKAWNDPLHESTIHYESTGPQS